MRISKLVVTITFFCVVSLLCSNSYGDVGELSDDTDDGNLRTFEFEGLTFGTPSNFNEIELPPYSESSGVPKFTSFYSNEDGDILIRCRLDSPPPPPPGFSDSDFSIDMTSQTHIETYALTYAANATGRMENGATINSIKDAVLESAGATAGCLVEIPLSETQKDIQGYDAEYLLIVSKAPDRKYLVSMAYKMSPVISPTQAIVKVLDGLKIAD